MCYLQDDDSEEGTEEDKSYKKWLLSSSDMEIEPLRFEDNLESYDIGKNAVD